MHERRPSLIRRAVAGERGIALVGALMTLVVLSTLSAGLLTVSRQEPAIADNQTLAHQARAVAESGLERALWALSNPAHADGIPESPYWAVAPPPYDGSVPISFGPGGAFRIRVTWPVAVNDDREIEVTGEAFVGSRRARSRLSATAVRTPKLKPTCALCILDDLKVYGNSTVDARTTANNQCDGVPPPVAGTISTLTTEIAKATKIYGPNDNTANQPVFDILTDAPASAVAIYTPLELEILKMRAKLSGSYFQGAQTFTPTASALPQGLVFVDTVSGAPLDETTPAADRGDVSIAGIQGQWNGILIASGRITIGSDVSMNGLLYALDDFKYKGATVSEIRGAVVAEHRQTSGSALDTNSSTKAQILYHCPYAQTGNGAVPRAFWVRPGSYRELAG